MIPGKILIADDEEPVREVVGLLLKRFGHQVVTVDSGRKLLETVCEDFDAIILDINMPDMDGFETLSGLNDMQCDIPVIFLTGAASMEYAIEAINLGAYDFLTKPVADSGLLNVKICRAVEKRLFIRREKAYMQGLEKKVREKTLELAEKNELLERHSRNLEKASLNMILSLQTALEAKDVYTAGHTARVTDYAVKIGQKMGLSGEDLGVLQRAGQLHDIGKLVIDNSAIAKPGPLTVEEWSRVRQHPEVGESIISQFGFLKREGDIVKKHHERMDGMGYPQKLAGEDLDTLTKIITVADSYDAMTSERCYRRNMTPGEAIDELRSCSNTQFDPDVVEVFSAIVTETDLQGSYVAGSENNGQPQDKEVNYS